MSTETKQMTVPAFRETKRQGRKLSMLTAYDYTSARLADRAGVDGILVGDSLGMVVQGRENTLSVTLDQMIYHAEIVARAAEHALLVVDMPFPTSHVSDEKTIESCARVMQETRCQAVKIEGGRDRADRIAKVVRAGIPVMGHVGLLPQNVHQMGGFVVQRDRDRLLEDARAIEFSGVFAIVLECVPADIAEEISRELTVPTIGIGAGPDCDGQILVYHDMLGITEGRTPRHVKKYAELGDQAFEAIRRYHDDVTAGRFPTDEHSF